jgi:predicted HAD superfamily Cof-like phosphohydrolase
MLRDFHRRVKESANSVPTEPQAWHAALRAKLILEEALELCLALGVRVKVITMTGAALDMHEEAKLSTDAAADWSPGWNATQLRAESPVDFVKAVDAMRDLEYVIHGTDLVLGTSEAAEETFEEVHRSNMGKQAGDGLGAKAIKPPDWTPPKLGKILRRIFPGQRLRFRD